MTRSASRSSRATGICGTSIHRYELGGPTRGRSTTSGSTARLPIRPRAKALCRIWQAGRSRMYLCLGSEKMLAADIWCLGKSQAGTARPCCGEADMRCGCVHFWPRGWLEADLLFYLYAVTPLILALERFLRRIFPKREQVCGYYLSKRAARKACTREGLVG